MARPIKKRAVCAKPDNHESIGEIILSVDEYETIRLIDYEGLTQSECATQMLVARTTIQAIYGSARKKLASALIEHKKVIIDGGDYYICSAGFDKCERCSRVCNRRNQIEENHIMKIAVTYENGEVFQHFGHTENFKIYQVEEGKVTSSIIVNTNGSGHGALAGFLDEAGVSVLICGGIGGGARNALSQFGMRVYPGVSGNADEAVQALLTGQLKFNAGATCNHHGEDHQCGEHHEHHCGGHCEH